MAKKSKVKLTGYRFLDKDPSVDAFREAKRKSEMSFAAIAEKGGMRENTLINWDLGHTKKPWGVTMGAAMAAMEFKQVWERGDGERIVVDYSSSIRKAEKRA